MASTFLGQKRIRKYYGKIREVLEMPNLIEVQKSSYDLFLNSGDQPAPMDGEGINGVFQSVFPIKDFNETAILEFVKYELEQPKYDVEECQQRDMTYSAPLKVTLRLIVFDIDEDTGAQVVKDIKEQDVFMGDMPLMTDEWHVHRERDRARNRVSDAPLTGRVLRPRQGQDAFLGQVAVRCRIIPYRGSWLDFEFDAKDWSMPHRPSPETACYHAAVCAGAGSGRHHGCLLQYGSLYAKKDKGWVTRSSRNVCAAPAGRRSGRRQVRRSRCRGRQEGHAARGQKLSDEGKVTDLLVLSTEIYRALRAKDIINEETGEIYVEAGDEMTGATTTKVMVAPEELMDPVSPTSLSTSITSTSALTSATRWRPTRT